MVQAINMSISVVITGQGLHDITRRVGAAVGSAGVKEGLCTLFIQHTSASF